MNLGQLNDQKVIVKVWRGAGMDMKSRERFTKKLSQELSAWQKLRHPNIGSFVGLTLGLGHLPALVFPYFHNGNVNQYIANNPNADVLHILTGVAAGLHYMHNQNPPITHGKLKGSNILISESGPPCLTDLGMRNLPYPHSLAMTNTASSVDEARWMAPELIDPDPSTVPWDDGYSVEPSADVYSFGMTGLELISGRAPYAHRRSVVGVIMDVVSGVRPLRPACPGMTDHIWDLLTKCWDHERTKRPDVGMVLSWIRLLYETRRALEFLRHDA
ncbi:kinase-like domain-containing protein [Crassisporium funariophilum]|nr:kinase-like domain-containing protein [Crassisporium funariophilum]